MATGRRAALPLLLWLAFSLAGALPYEPNAKYNGWQVLQVPLEGESPEELVREFHNLEDSNVLQVLRVSRGQDDTEPGLAEIAVSPSSEKEIKNMMRKKGLAFTTVISDLATKLSVDEPSLRRAALLRGAITFERFMSFEEIQAYVEDLPNLYPGRVKVKELGRSAENRPILMVIVQSGSARRSPVIFVDGGMHAREWVSPAAATYLVGRLLESPDLTRDVEWRVIPLLNPDGYVYSWTHDRLWRKNRARFDGLDCVGVDINRNFDHAWGGPDSSPDPCASNHMGRQPFSERETRAVRDVVLQGNRTEVYVTLHSYGQEIIFPWVSDLTTLHRNHEKMSLVAEGMAREIEANDGTEFRVGNGKSFSYVFGGTSIDWAAGGAGVPLVFAMELRDMRHFIIPEDLIQPAVEDVWLSMKFVAEEIMEPENSAERETERPDAEIVESPSKTEEVVPVQSVTENGAEANEGAMTTVNPDTQGTETIARQPSTTTPAVPVNGIPGLEVTPALTEVVDNALRPSSEHDAREDSAKKPTLWKIVLS